MFEAPPEHPDWSEERLRYQVLQYIYHRAVADGTHGIDCSEVGSALRLRYEDLFRALYFLEAHHLLYRTNGGAECRITPEGARYIEDAAQRRRSVRSLTS